MVPCRNLTHPNPSGNERGAVRATKISPLPLPPTPLPLVGGPQVRQHGRSLRRRVCWGPMPNPAVSAAWRPVWKR